MKIVITHYVTLSLYTNSITIEWITWFLYDGTSVYIKCEFLCLHTWLVSNSLKHCCNHCSSVAQSTAHTQ